MHAVLNAVPDNPLPPRYVCWKIYAEKSMLDDAAGEMKWWDEWRVKM